MIFIKKISNFGKKYSFYFISLNFLFYYCCPINLKRQSEHSGLRPDTSSLVFFYLLCCLGFHEQIAKTSIAQNRSENRRNGWIGNSLLNKNYAVLESATVVGVCKYLSEIRIKLAFTICGTRFHLGIQKTS